MTEPPPCPKCGAEVEVLTLVQTRDGFYYVVEPPGAPPYMAPAVVGEPTKPEPGGGDG